MMANSTSKTKRVLRALLVFYPVFAGILYLACVHSPRSQTHDTKQKTQELIASGQIKDAKVEMKRKREKQRKQIQELIEAFQSSSRDIDLTGMPAFIGDIARESGIRFSGFNLTGRDKIQDHSFAILNLEMEGPFDSIVTFIGKLESHGDKFVKIQQFTIKPGSNPVSRRLNMKVALLNLEGSAPRASKEIMPQ